MSNTKLFILVTAFLNLSGIGIIAPVLPFITGQYIAENDLPFVSALLFTSYALFQFLATPTLGALSDFYGRRPVLLISLFGSAIGYFIIGIGGALWVLFLGRIIDGITGGNIATIYAYAADITDPKNRTRFFGIIGSVAGFGFVFGPAVGGIAYRMTGSYAAPMYLAGVMTLLNVLWGYFAMPESLPAEQRDPQFNVTRLNPFTQLLNVFRIPQVRLLLLATFLWSVSFAVLQSNLSVLTEDQLGWDVDNTSFVFTVVGIVGIITQGGIVRQLLPRLGEGRMATLGMISMMLGFVLISLVGVIKTPVPLFLGIIPTAFGNGLIIPSLSGMLSSVVSRSEQGRIQGGNQSIQALARVIGPVIGGWIYTVIFSGAPYIAGAVGLALAALTVVASMRYTVTTAKAD